MVKIIVRADYPDMLSQKTLWNYYSKNEASSTRKNIIVRQKRESRDLLSCVWGKCFEF